LQTLLLTHNDHSVTFQFSVLDFIDAERNQYRYKLENFDTDWIENGTNNTATFTSLPAGNYNLRVQGANSAGIWNREGISLNITMLPAPWFTWWAYSLYALTLMCGFWAIHRIYYSYVVEKRSSAMALEMFEAENRADDEMQEQLEMQDEWVDSAYQHSQTTLSLISDSISIRNSNADYHTKSQWPQTCLGRVAALSRLEDCLCYKTGGSFADLHKYTDGLIPGLLESSPINPQTIVTINEVTTNPIPTELASSFAIIIYELLENCIQHAFEPDSPVNYIHIKLDNEEISIAPYRCWRLYIQDSGVGSPVELENLKAEGSGIAVVRSIVAKLEGRLDFSSASGTTVVVEIPFS